MKNILLFFSLLIFTACHAQEVYDVEMLPFYRTKSYATESTKKIIVFSAPRTGSSLVYNVFKFLFEEDSKLLGHHFDSNSDHRVIKIHTLPDVNSMNKKDTLYVYTFRNPFDAAVSHYRITLRQDIDNKAFTYEVVNCHRKYLLFSNNMEKKKYRLIMLKYENFVNDIDYIFEQIENNL